MADVDFRLPDEPIARTFGQRVAGTIREAIIRGELANGQFLRQEELATRFQISRIPLREALQQLEKEGFVVIVPYRGAAVAPVSAAESREIVELMVALHCLTLRLAFPHMTAETLDQVEQIGEMRRRVQDAGQFARLSIKYWNLLLLPANRPLLFSMLNHLHNRAMRYASYYLPVWMKDERLRNLYLDVTRACREGNLEVAVAALEKGYWIGWDQLAARLNAASQVGAKPAKTSQTRRSAKRAGQPQAASSGSQKRSRRTRS